MHLMQLHTHAFMYPVHVAHVKKHMQVFRVFPFFLQAVVTVGGHC